MKSSSGTWEVGYGIVTSSKDGIVSCKSGNEDIQKYSYMIKES